MRANLMQLEASVLTQPVSQLVLHSFFGKSTLTERDFLAGLAGARLISPKDPLLSEWNYSPWYSGSFSTPAGLHRFELYLGGLGCLTLPDGRCGYFLLGP